MIIHSNVTKAQLGAIGEHMVAAKVLAEGWDAILANMSVSNIKSYDIVCVHPTGQTALVQVKTSVGKNIPIGMSLRNAVKEKLNERIVGPWVFVYLEKKGNEYVPRYFVLSRSEMISLTSESNDWYCYQWKSSFRKAPVSQDNQCGIKVEWLEGKGEKDNDRHSAFTNPLSCSAEDQWHKIWEE